MITASEFLKWLEVFNVTFGSHVVPFPISMSEGGTGAALTPTNNSIFISGPSHAYLLATADNGVYVTDSSGNPSISSTLPSAVQSNITELGTQSEALNMGSHLINNVTDPVSLQDAATRNYVDNVAQGLNILPACIAATTANLNALYNNGISGVGATLTNLGTLAAFQVDGVTPALNSPILIKNQTTTYENGVYILTTVGSASVAWILTRATYYDTSAQINPGDFVIIDQGTVNAVTGWVQTATVTTIGTDPITFSQFGAVYPLSPANGGTGINNGSNTLTITDNSDINQDVRTSASPTFNSITLTSGTVANAPINPIDIANKAYVDSVVAGGGLVPVNVTSTPITLAPGKVYFVNNGASEVTFNLPVTSAFGDNYAIYGFSSGGYKVVASGGQTIQMGNISGGTITYSNRYDAVNLYCFTASTIWVGNVLQGDPDLA